MPERGADGIGNRAEHHQSESPLAKGDRALTAVLRAHGLVMNGGVFNSVEVMTRDEFNEALGGYRFFGLSEVSELLARAFVLVQREGADIGSQEQSFDAEYERLIPDDSFLFSVFEKYLQAQPADFASTLASIGAPGEIPVNLEEALRRYREAAIGNADPHPVKANRCHDIVHTCYKFLKASEEGRKGIMSLMVDENPYVRVWAAGHSLQWEPETARRILEGIRDSDGPGSISAKYTLIEYDKGKLTFDW
jgi:hypothetical protein